MSRLLKLLGVGLIGAAMVALAGHEARAAEGCFPPPASCKVTSHFGMRFHPTEKEWRIHKGTDFGCPIGTPLSSVESGTVLRAVRDVGGGNVVVVRGSSGRDFKYMHMSHFSDSAARLSAVNQGALVGNSGNTGKWTTGPHLHFEAWRATTPVDPEKFICGAAPRTDEEMGEPSSHEVPGSGSAQKPGTAGVPDQPDGSLFEVMDNIIGVRALNPDYAYQLATLSRERLYAELAYLEAASLRIQAEKAAAKERMEVMLALRQVLLAEKVLKPALIQARNRVLAQ